MVLFTMPPVQNQKVSEHFSHFGTEQGMGGRGATLSLYLTTENLGDLHAMIPGFTDLIGVFAIKVDDDEDFDDGFITITRFFPIYQLRLQHTSSCSKIHFAPPLSGELIAWYHVFDFLHPHV